jgi:hypothetical protein
MSSDHYTEDCPSCGDTGLIREDRITGGRGMRLPYTRWTCARCRFIWYTPLFVAPEPAPSLSGVAE